MAGIRSLLGRAFVPYQFYLRLFKAKCFAFQGHTYNYFYHAYNRTWLNERTVEVPIVQEMVKEYEEGGKNVLEVGNVLQHYFKGAHEIVDKYEVAPGVINEDVVTFKPEKKYDLIVSISTLEHVGWDETPKEQEKIPAALKNMVSLLAPGGKIIFTVPLGQNPWLDQLIMKNELGLSYVVYMNRIPGTNEWVESEKLEWAPPKEYKESTTLVVGAWDIRGQIARVSTPSATTVLCIGFIEKK